MMTNKYKMLADQFAAEYPRGPNGWESEFPDEFLAVLETIEDLSGFISVVLEYKKTHYIDNGCKSADEFLEDLVKNLVSEDSRVHEEKVGIKSDIGRIALAMLYSYGG